MNEEVNDDGIATHAQPAWRDKADYILQADLTPYNMDERLEQLWAKQQGEKEFIICCIPFFTYGIALGDTVVAKNGFLEKLIRKGPHRNLRMAIVQEDRAADIHVRLHDWVEQTGLLYEWWKNCYLAVAVTDQNAPDLSLLQQLEQTGEIEYEIDG